MKARFSLIGAITAVVFSGAIGRLQEAAARTPAELREEIAAIQAQFEEAKELVRSGDYAAAAALYEQIAAEHPKTMKGQKAAVEAGINYDRAGQTDKAVHQLDFAASLCVASSVSEFALYQKALVCEASGCAQDALAAINCLRIAYPESGQIPGALEIKARIQGMTPQQLEALKARELEAADILAQAAAKLATKTERAEALVLIDRIETHYADTSSAVSALLVKGDTLHALGRYEDAQNAYKQLRDRVVPLAPRSQFAVKARMGVAFERVHRAVQLCEQSIVDRSSKDEGMVEEARAACNGVIDASDASPTMLARARALLVEIEIFDQRPERAESLAEEFLTKNYPRQHHLKTYPQWILVMHLGIAEAARMRQNYDKALHKCEEIKQLFSQLPEKRRAAMQPLLKRVYFQNFLALVESRADRERAVAAGHELMTRFPDPRSDDVVTRRLRWLSSQPAP